MRKRYFNSLSRSAGKPQKMHRLCGARKRKESSAVEWFGSINYLTKPPRARRSSPLPPAYPSPSTFPLLCQRFKPRSICRSFRLCFLCTILLPLSLSFPFNASTPPSTPTAAPDLKFHREHENRNFDRSAAQPSTVVPPSTARKRDVDTTDT